MVEYSDRDLMNNNFMNKYSKENKSGLKTATLENNITMDNHTRTYILDEPVPHTRTYILDEPVPHIGVETLRPTPFRRIIQKFERYYEESSRCSEEKMERLLRLDFRLRSTTYTGWFINKKIEESYQRTIPTVS